MKSLCMGATSHALWCLLHSYNVLAWGQSLQMFLEFNLIGGWEAKWECRSVETVVIASRLQLDGISTKPELRDLILTN